MTGTDFSDKLSPMLVKELRQGLRAKVFLWSFIIIQVAMILLVGFRVLAARVGTGFLGPVFDGFFWFMLAALLLFLMPSRAAGLIQEERKEHTLELLQMTWLSSLRIVLGKWLSVMTLALLLVVALLPYLVLRYFFGGMDVVGTLYQLAKMTMGCGVLTALGLYSSAMNQRLAGGALLPLLLVVLYALMSFMDAVGATSGMRDLVQSCVLLAPAYTLYFLLLTAGRIASEAESLVHWQRLLAWGCCLLGAVVGGWQGHFFWLAGMLPMALGVCLQAVTSLPSTLPSTYAWGARRGRLGWWWNRLLTPGWASGVGYCLLTWLLLLGCHELLVLGSGGLAAETRLVWGLVLPALLFPLAVFRLAGWHGVPWPMYLLVQAICWALVLVIGRGLAANALKPEDWLISLTPLSALTAYQVERLDYLAQAKPILLGLVLPVAVITVLVCLWAAWQHWKLISLLEKRSQNPTSPSAS